MTLVQSEPKAIKIGIPGGDDYSAMQGPCPDGFHVPLNSEWGDIYSILITTLGLPSTDTTMKTYIKLPLNGQRNRANSNVTNQGTIGGYQSSTYKDGDTSYYFGFNSSNIYPHSSNYRSVGYSIRGFKDTPVTPDSSWTVLYQGTGDAGIYHNSTLGLISVSGDGATWITIMDKNLGATTVYNSGDTLSEANCGGYFQWGNNHMFPFTGSVTTSSTQVNASTYGPGNYYSSSTFITGTIWDSSNNKDLRGGETGVIQRIDTDIKAVYLGTTKVRPAYKPRTFTITRTEKSDMSSGWTYSDDAAGLTAGDGAFDDFFGYSAVLLNTSGVETAEMTQSGGVFTGAMSTLGNITSGDNVMIKFPVRGIKMTKSGSTVTLSITDGLGRENEGYQYYAHCTGTLSNPGTPKDAFYIGAYEGFNYANVLKSWSGRSPTGNKSPSEFITYARANDGNSGASGYDICGFYQLQYINALYMMKYGNPNSQSVVGKGYTGGSAAINTGGTNSQTSATYGTSSATTQIKLFGIEDWWGNMLDTICGAYTDGDKYLYTALHWVDGGGTTSSPYENTGIFISSGGGTYPNISSISGTNKAMFAPISTVNNSSYNTYWCSGGYVETYTTVISGGSWSNGNSSGAFRLYVSWHDWGGSKVGARLMYLNGLT